MDPLIAAKRKRFTELRAQQPDAPREAIIAQVERELAGAAKTPGFAAESTAATGGPAPSRGLLEDLAGAGRSLMQGLTFQNWDEIEGGVRALGSDTYKGARDQVRQEMEGFRNAYPTAAGALELGGAAIPAVAAMALSGGTATPAVAARTAPIIGRMAQGAAMGGAMGAAQGVGTAPELKDVPGSVATAGGVGAGLGLAFPLLGAGLSRGAGFAGDVTESAVRGAAEGQGAIPALAQRGMGWANRRADARAMQSLYQRLIEDGLTPEQAATRLREMTARGTPAAVADVGETNMLELANRPVLIGGEGRQRMSELATGRVAGSADRLATAAERTSGTRMGNVNQMVRDIAQRRKAPAAELYDRAFAHGNVTLDDRGLDILMSTDGQRAWREGLRRSMLDESPGARPRLQPLFRETTNRAGEKEIVLLREPTVRDVNYIKRGLDAQIAAAERQGDADLVRVLTKAKNDVLAQVDGQVPVYAEARAFWGGEEGLMSALEAGKKFARGAADDFDDVVAGLNPDELQMYRTGAVNFVREQLERRDGSVNAVRFLSDPTVMRRLQRLFPDEESFQMLKAVVGDERKLAALDMRLRNQSATAKNLLEVGEEMTGMRAGDITPSGGLMDLLSRGANAVGTAATGQARASSSDALARLLSKQGEEGAALLETLGPRARREMERQLMRGRLGGSAAGYLGGLSTSGNR